MSTKKMPIYSIKFTSMVQKSLLNNIGFREKYNISRNLFYNSLKGLNIRGASRQILVDLTATQGEDAIQWDDFITYRHVEVEPILSLNTIMVNDLYQELQKLCTIFIATYSHNTPEIQKLHQSLQQIINSCNYHKIKSLFDAGEFNIKE